MFARIKASGPRKYLQIVESFREGSKVKQGVIVTLGRIDLLEGTGRIDALINCLSRFADKVKVIDLIDGGLRGGDVKKIGPDLVMGRLWRELGVNAIIHTLLCNRGYEFNVERAIYFTVLSRLFFAGSERKALRLSRDYKIEGKEYLELHHFYRAMAFLGGVKDEIEEGLFVRNRDLFSGLNLVFFDTTSIYFEGNGGESLGQYGYSKDRRSDEKQMVVGAVIDSGGRPISCPMWPGNMADVKTLIPLIERLKGRFGVGDIVIVADRGMVSKETVEKLERLNIGYILGVKMRKEKEVREEVIRRGGKYRDVKDKLKVKEVQTERGRYIVCLNPEEADRDAVERAAIIESLKEKLQRGPTAFIGNRGYKKYLRIKKTSFEIDEAKIKADERFDGKYVLRTNTSLSTQEVALRYKELWQVERIFREVKSVLETRPIYHKYDATIKGHVFCSFLALVLMKELIKRLDFKAEWNAIRQDLDSLYETEIKLDSKKYLVRSELQGISGKVCRSVGIAIPPSVVRL